MTQLLVINTQTMEAKAFDGRVFIDKAKLDIDEDTTKEGLIEVLEDFRMTSTVAFKEARRQMDLMELQIRESIRYVPKEYAYVNVSYNGLKTPV